MTTSPDIELAPIRSTGIGSWPGTDMIDAIKEGIARDRETRKQLDELAEIQSRYDSLTSREREVFALVTEGALNKQIAHQLGTSERTIKAHRAQVVQKMKADSVADLVRMADRLKIVPQKSTKSAP